MFVDDFDARLITRMPSFLYHRDDPLRRILPSSSVLSLSLSAPSPPSHAQPLDASTHTDAIEVYFPPTCIDEKELESFDGVPAGKVSKRLENTAGAITQVPRLGVCSRGHLSMEKEEEEEGREQGQFRVGAPLLFSSLVSSLLTEKEQEEMSDRHTETGSADAVSTDDHKLPTLARPMLPLPSLLPSLLPYPYSPIRHLGDPSTDTISPNSTPSVLARSTWPTLTTGKISTVSS